MSEQGEVDTIGGAQGSGVASLGLGAQYAKAVTFSAPTTPEVFSICPRAPTSVCVWTSMPGNSVRISQTSR